MTTLEQFRSKFHLDELTILETEHWTWSVRPTQTTLGSGVLSLNRLCPSLGGMTEDEGRDLTIVVRQLETTLRATFAPDRLNYLIFMLVDAHVHMHILPRYAGPRHFADETWIDSGWPRPLDMQAAPTETSQELLFAIRERLVGA